MYLSKNENGEERTDFGSSSQYVNCKSDFAFLHVNCFQRFSCAKQEAWKQQICWNGTWILISHEVLQNH